MSTRPATLREFLEKAASALFALTTLFLLWTVGVLGVPVLTGGPGRDGALRALAISGLLAALALTAVWALRRYARRLPPAAAPRDPVR